MIGKIIRPTRAAGLVLITSHALSALYSRMTMLHHPVFAFLQLLTFQKINALTHQSAQIFAFKADVYLQHIE
jgi:hypothetical protein